MSKSTEADALEAHPWYSEHFPIVFGSRGIAGGSLQRLIARRSSAFKQIAAADWALGSFGTGMAP
jgi:hypothetical protein